MKNLFYSETEKIVFEIVGYSEMDNTDNVKTQMSVLTNNYNHFSKKWDTKEINTKVITKSSRYKYMRVFYATLDKKPVDAFLISSENNWTMNKWLEN